MDYKSNRFFPPQVQLRLPHTLPIILPFRINTDLTMMKQVLALLVAFAASAQAFAPMAKPAFSVASTALNMNKNAVAAAVAGTVPAILSSTAAIATDGTNEMFGVDDIRLLAVLFLGHWAILSLWLGAYGDADESEDFFGEIDYTGK
jgi:hypothetical protein